MTDSCCSGKGETLIFTCAGAAYSGQLANRAGLQLTKDGLGALFCIAALAANRRDKMERTRQAARRVAIDGCEDHCCLHILEAAGLRADVHVVVTDLGIEKQPERPNMLIDARRVAGDVRTRLDRIGKTRE